MLDLETLGTSSNSSILSIGAVEFDKDLGITDRFYEVIDLQSCLDYGFDIDGNTFYWWLKQSEEAQKALSEQTKISIKEALKKFQDFIGKGNLQMWGNGSDFDNVILINAFRKFKVNNPWKYIENRCYRTMKYSFPSFEMKNVGTSHRSVDDAEYQALYLIELVNRNKLKNVL